MRYTVQAIIDIYTILSLLTLFNLSHYLKAQYFYCPLNFELLFFFCCRAGTEGERPAAAHHKNRRLPHDFSDCDGGLGCSYQVRVVAAVFNLTKKRLRL